MLGSGSRLVVAMVGVTVEVEVVVRDTYGGVVVGVKVRVGHDWGHGW